MLSIPKLNKWRMASGYPIYMQMDLYAYITLSIMNGIIKCHGQKPSYRGRPYGCSIMKSGEKPGTALDHVTLNVKKGELMSDSNLSLELELTSVVQEVKTVLTTARQNVATQVNSELLNTYWNIGRIICEHEQSDPERADYGKQTIKELSKALTKEFGKGFSRSNLQNMR